MTAALVVLGAYALMGLVALTFHHTHPDGRSCGWSGCQVKESP